MAYLAVDKDGTEVIFELEPIRSLDSNTWLVSTDDWNYVNLPKGSIEKLIDKKLTWEDKPFEMAE